MALTHPILERDAPLAQLEALWQSAAGGTGGVAFVTGEAGAGKTTLLRAFERRAPAARLLRGACEDLSIPEPLGPLRDLTRDADIALDALFRNDRDHLVSFGHLLAAIEAPDEATLLMIEDLHWADEVTLDFLRFVARRVRTRRVLIVVTSRDDDTEGRPQIRRALRGVPVSDVTRIALRPLSAEAVARLAAGSRQDPRDLHRLTGGNAFYVSEVLRSGVAEGLRTVQDTVLDRIGRLSSEAQALMEAVSVFPRRAERSLAFRAAEMPDDDEAIDEAAAAGLIEDDGTHLAFRHETARQAMETALRPARRRRLNMGVLAAMEESEGVPNARLLHHARAANDRARMARLAPLAGREALAAGANGQAAEYLTLAVELADHDDAAAMSALLWDAAEACNNVARLRDALGLFERALSLTSEAKDPLAASRLLQRVSRLHWLMGRKSQARIIGDRAVGAASGRPSPELAMALASRAQIAMADFDTVLSRALCDQAIPLARQLGRTEILAHALSTLAMVATCSDAERLTVMEESLSLARAGRPSLNLARSLFNAGVVHFYYFQDYAAALAHIEQSLALGNEFEVHQLNDFDRAFQAALLERTGHWDEATAVAAALIEEKGEQSSPAIMSRLTHARILMRRGAVVEDGLLAEIVALLGDDEDVRHVTDVAGFFAERAWLGLETRDTARAWIDRALARPCPPVNREELLFWQQRIEPGRPVGPLDGVHRSYSAAILGDWRTAADEWARLRDPYREALALAQGGPEAVARGLAILDRLGATAVAERLRAEASARAQASPGQPPPRVTRPPNPWDLTRRQLDVLRLLNEGATNAEIAKRLFVSPKTVDHHVSAILGKLGASTRGEAAALAREAGWLPATASAASGDARRDGKTADRASP